VENFEQLGTSGTNAVHEIPKVPAWLAAGTHIHRGISTFANAASSTFGIKNRLRRHIPKFDPDLAHAGKLDIEHPASNIEHLD
jgi:hypothetical protein